MNRKALVTKIIRLKFLVRAANRQIKKSKRILDYADQVIAKLEADPFSKHKIARITDKINAVKEDIEAANYYRKGLYQELVSAMLAYDKLPKRTHETAQLLGVHPVHIKENNGLFELAALQTELAGEDSLKTSRSHILFDAYAFSSQKMFFENKEFRESAYDFLQVLSVENTGRPLKIYKQDGKGEMIATPPKLKVIKSC
jgi:sulfur transfer complex TusBCD TusB component (DsrH family)